MRAPRISRTLAVFAVSALLAAACSSSADVDVEQSTEMDPISTSTTTESAPTPSADDTIPDDTIPDDEPADSADLPALSEVDPDTLTGTLDNGLRYLVRSNDNPGSKVELRLVVDAGSGLEADDQVGGAHFLEHMLFNGTERFPKNELVDVLRSFGAAFGADVNASTSYDETTYILNVPNTAEAVGAALDILEDWLSAASLTPDDVEAERGIVLDEWRARGQSANGRIVDSFAPFLLAGSVYEDHLPIGGKDAIESITPEALRSFYDDWYRPDNAAIIVVGDIDASAIEGEVAERFASVESRGDDPERVDLLVSPSTDTKVEVFADPDLAEGFVLVDLPLPSVSTSPEADAQRSILDELALDIVGTRLDNDALRGEAPFDRASAGTSALVRLLTSPEITVDADGASAGASVQAVVDEFERVVRFGFTEAEVERAVTSRRASAQRNLDGANSRQDTSYAEEYTRHVLEGEWYVPAQQEFDFTTEVLDRATVETVADGLVDRYESAGIHTFVAVPESEVDDVAEPSELVEIIDSAGEREVEPRMDDVAIGDALVEAPEPVEEEQAVQLSTRAVSPLLDPVVLEFANGVSVSLNTTNIVDNEVYLSARSPGGSSRVEDALVPDAQALGPVIGDSGAGAFDRVALAQFLDDKSIQFVPEVTPLTSEIGGVAAATDIEVLFQLIYVLMTDPNVDDTAVERYVDDALPFALDPSIDAGYAEFDALSQARYDDPRYQLPTPDSLDAVDVADIETVAQQLFQVDGQSWAFALSGDYDIDEVTDLARRYIGSLPGTSAPIDGAVADPPPPDGVVVARAEGGEGETANVSFLFAGAATADRRDDVVASIVGEIVSNRLTDFIREELGDSYSPFAQIDLGDGETPSTELYISVSTGPDLVDEVSAAVVAQLTELRDDGPSDREFSNAVTTVNEQLGFIDNVQINEEVLDVLVDPDGNASFDDFVNQGAFIGEITRDDVTAAINDWVDLDQYIEVQITPRP